MATVLPAPEATGPSVSRLSVLVVVCVQTPPPAVPLAVAVAVTASVYSVSIHGPPSTSSTTLSVPLAVLGDVPPVMRAVYVAMAVS